MGGNKKQVWKFLHTRCREFVLVAKWLGRQIAWHRMGTGAMELLKTAAGEDGNRERLWVADSQFQREFKRTNGKYTANG
jgi:hypothetical protein